MAVCIPNTISFLNDASSGEKRVFKLLKESLSEDNLIYYKVKLNNKYVDFVILGPEIGLVILEVRDWKLSNISKANEKDFILDMPYGKEKFLNPYEEARQYRNNIFNILNEKDVLSDDIFEKLKFPISTRLVFTSIKKTQFEDSKIKDSIDLDYIIFQDDIINLEKDVNSEDAIIKKLNDFSSKTFKVDNISKIMIDKIRGSLFPETIINESTSIIQVMDIEQEQVAKGLGEGHRVIRGVAGSGKSIILMCRAKYLASKYPKKRILVLCYNKSFASYLKKKLPYENIIITHFHKWINKLNRDILNARGAIYKDEDTNNVCLELLNNENRLYKYDAILIDEGQDFHENWLRLVVNSLKDKEEGSLLLVSDGAQNLYNRDYSFIDVGIQARGRSKVFRKNYRNTNSILKFAESYIEGATDSLDKEYENNFIIKPDEILRQGDPVEIYKYDEEGEEKEFIIHEIRNLLSTYSKEEICILVSVNKLINNYIEILERLGIGCNNLKEENSIVEDMINISTIHSAKGFEFKVVFLVGIEDNVFSYLNSNSNINQLIYVGMTRAVDKLYISCQKNSQMCYLIDKGIETIKENKYIVNTI